MPDLLSRLQSSLADRYAIEREVGRGGMATVYRARDLRHDRDVALKVLAPEIALALGPERFLREIRIAARLQHPHILPLLDSGEADGLLFYVMPFVAGESLREHQLRRGPLPLPELVTVLREVVDALACAHQNGIVHRDIKPENVMLSGRHALVTDFGVAKAVSQSTATKGTTVGVAIGTPAYMAPEQAAGDPAVDHRADIYAVGVLAYELLTGQPPFSGPTPQAVLAAQLTGDPEPITGRARLPAAFSQLIMKCLRREPAERWQSADELLRELDLLASSVATGSPRGPSLRWWAAAVAAAVAVGGLGYFTYSRVAARKGEIVTAAAATAAGDSAAATRGRAFLIMPFRNLAGSSRHQWLVEASPTMLADALGQWREVSVVPDERLYPALRRHALQPGTVMELDQLRKVAAETGGWTAVVGEVIDTGNRIQITTRAFDTVTGNLVTRVSTEVAPDGDVRQAYEHIATSLLHGAGLDQATADLAGATTRSLDAYRAYLRGTAHLNRGEYRQARRELEAAVARDSSFAQAYARLAEVSLLAFSVLEPEHPAYGYAERAAALSGRLPLRAATQVRALRSLITGDFTGARGILEQMVAEDPNDVDAIETLASLEFLDPLLVGPPGRERRRGSLNAAVRRATRVLELDPSRHGAYQGLVVIYSLAGGLPPGAVAGYRREVARPIRSSVRAWCSCDFEIAAGASAREIDSAAAVQVALAGPDVMLVPLLRDSLELVPLDSLATLPPAEVAAARTRARGVARSWVRRWLAVGPREAEAHRAAARVYELEGDFNAALQALERAESLGMEGEAEAVAARRMILLGKSGRLDAARAIADSLWRAHYFAGELFELVPAMTEAYAWATNLFALAGDFARVRAALAAFSARLSLRLEPDAAYAATIAALSGIEAPLAPAILPAEVRHAVADALRAELARAPGDPLLNLWRRTLEQPTR